MPAIRTSKGASQRRATAAVDPITPPQSRRRPQVARTPEAPDSQDEEALLEMRIEAAQREQRIKRLQQRLNQIQRGEEIESSAGSSQTLEVQAPQAIPSFYNGMESNFLPLALRYPAINVKHFKNIANNKFEVENIVKLTTDFSTVKTNKKYIRMGEVDLQTRDDDAHAGDIKGIMQLVQCFLIYAQILLHFSNPATRESLNQGLMFYIDRLIKHAHLRTWESTRNFHFIFHKTCLARGVADPEVWKTVDSNLESQHLIMRIAPLLNGGYPSNRSGPNAPTNRNQQTGGAEEMPVCFKFNGRGCDVQNCKFRHICRQCGGPHAMGACRNPNTTPLGKRD